jgi:hypothetical protein
MITFCQCTNPPVSWAGKDRNEPFCGSCLKRIEIKEPYAPDPDRAVWIKKEPTNVRP